MSSATVAAKAAEALALGLTPQQIVMMCDLAIGELLVKGYASYQVAGRNLTFSDLETVRGVREYFRSEQLAVSAPMAMNLAEL